MNRIPNYYDLALADRFEEVFGDLLIGSNPTEVHNKYFILEWNFSYVDSVGSTESHKCLH
jgi:hypothetical protein